MKTDPAKAGLTYQAAVECAFSAVFSRQDGTWEGHDYKVEIVVERLGLDPFDVVMDFRVLEKKLSDLLDPLKNQLLPQKGISDLTALAKRLLQDLSPNVKAPVNLHSLSLTDGSGRRLTVFPKI